MPPVFPVKTSSQLPWYVAALLLFSLRAVAAAPDSRFDVVVYGGTSAGVMAAVQAQRMGKSVVLVSPEPHLGGISSSGLGFTDSGDHRVVGGLAREFYHRIWQHYQDPTAWRWQTRSTYGNRGQSTKALDDSSQTAWVFEPHVAEATFEAFIREAGVHVDRGKALDRAHGVRRDGRRIAAITMLDGTTYAGLMFIDATYEGDLMAAAGVTYRVGREANREYGEQYDGVQTGVFQHAHNFRVLSHPVSPYVIPGDPKSGVIAGVSTAPPGENGAADRRVQAYCFRLCLTAVPENRVPWPKPDGYDPTQYELLARIYAAGWNQTFSKFDPVPNRKTDTNNHGPMSTDFIGANSDYPEASYERRREILRAHENYEKGWFYFVAHDPRVPAAVQARMQTWGLARDEFTDNGNWPYELYVREARRMVGVYVMTEHDLLRHRVTPDSVGMGSYSLDSHNVQRYITPEGAVQNEGDLGVRLPGPYAVAYGAIVPKKIECENLLVPVCLSSTHSAYGSMRMEPVFMILGQSAATAAALALDRGTAIQDVPYSDLRSHLLAAGQVLAARAAPLPYSPLRTPAPPYVRLP